MKMNKILNKLLNTKELKNQIKQLEAENRVLKDRNDELYQENIKLADNDTKMAKIERLQQVCDHRIQIIHALRNEIKQLKEKNK